MSLWLVIVGVLVGLSNTDRRINLAEFGRSVRFEGDTPAMLEAHELESSPDGWAVWTGEDGQSMIGLEWDEPRVLAEAEIEFRHAIADRDQIRVQYFLPHMPTTQPAAEPMPDDPFHGQWVTAKSDWWAGDRFVGFAFAPMNEELKTVGVPADATRRTRRLRFLLGKRNKELPPVRYLRAYGPARPVEAAFEIRLDRRSPLMPPLRASVVNGLLIDEDGKPTRSMTVEATLARLKVRHAEGDRTSGSRTIVTLADDKNSTTGFSFLPAEVVERGTIHVSPYGASIAHVGTSKDLAADSKPAGASVFDRLNKGGSLSLEEMRRELQGVNSVAAGLDDLLKRHGDRYRPLLNEAMAVELPEPFLNTFWQAQILKLLVQADARPDDPQAAASVAAFARSVRLPADCHHVRALEYVGLSALNDAFFDACVMDETLHRLAGRFPTNQEGVLAIPTAAGRERPDRSCLEHAAVLELFSEHYRFTGDRRWLARQASRLAAACDFISRHREGDEESDTLAKEDKYWGQGLLPPGPIEGSPSWLWWFTVNAYAARGLRMTAESLAEVNDVAADRLAGQATAFKEHLARSCGESMLRSPVMRLAEGQYVPIQPICSRLRGRGESPQVEVAYGAVHLIGTGVYAPDSPQAEWILRDAEDNLLPSVGIEYPVKPGAGADLAKLLRLCEASPVGPPPLVSAYLLRQQPQHALRAFDLFMAADLAVHAVRGDLDRDAPSHIGAALLVWLRQLLILEHGGELDLLAGVPADWLAPGKRITVRRAPTWFGPVNLDIESAADANRVTVRLDASWRQEPAGVRLWVRTPRPMRTVLCNGQRLASLDVVSGMIRLPASTERAEIVVTY
ncbi:MAG TPA: hypothetical protein VLM89_10410 [Phycisphaerae bacterium]|nr:hypothetical protein [Phycisphaerae bacterium]